MDPILAINSTVLVSEISTLLFQRFEWLYGALKGLGILLILYLIYLLFNAFTQNKMKRRVKRIEQKVNAIESKLDILVLKLIGDSSKNNNFSRHKKPQRKRVSKK